MQHRQHLITTGLTMNVLHNWHLTEKQSYVIVHLLHTVVKSYYLLSHDLFLCSTALFNSSNFNFIMIFLKIFPTVPTGYVDQMVSNNQISQYFAGQVYATHTYLFQNQHKSVLFGHKWRITAAGIVINNHKNPKITYLFSYKFDGGPHKVHLGLLIIIQGALIVHLCQNGTLLTQLKIQFRTYTKSTRYLHLHLK